MANKYILKKSNFRLFISKIDYHKIFKNDIKKQPKILRTIQSPYRLSNRAFEMTSKLSAIINAIQNPVKLNRAIDIASKPESIIRAIQYPQRLVNRTLDISKTSEIMSAIDIASKPESIIRAIQNRHQLTNQAFDMVDQLENMHRFQNQWKKSFKTILADIDEKVKDYRIKQFEYLEAAKKQQWYLDEELLDYCFENRSNKRNFQDSVFNEEIVVNYVIEHLEDYINSIVNSSCYETQKKIINQSVYAFQNNQYEIAIFPLFGAFDNIISRWARNELMNLYNHKDVYIFKLRNKLKQSIEKYKSFEENIQSIQFLKGINVISAYIDLFDNKPKDLTKMNRNAILHGSYNYELITRNSYLKMIVLLKSALSLLEVSPTEFQLSS